MRKIACQHLKSLHIARTEPTLASGRAGPPPLLYKNLSFSLDKMSNIMYIS